MTAQPEPESFDALIIGAGQGGIPLARELAGAGWKTGLVERAELGGTCINRGCTPTKTMAAAARVAHLARRGGDYGVEVPSVSVDIERVARRTWSLVEEWRAGHERRVEATPGLELIRGEARFVDPRTLVVALEGRGERVLAAPVVVIDTGTRPAIPSVPGLERLHPLDSTSVMRLDRVPDHLLILGGGPVGVEFGQMFRRFGSAVTIVERHDRLLGREDDDVSRALEAILEEDGIEVLLATRTTEASAGEGGGVRLEVEGGEGGRILHGTHLIVAAGRAPNTQELDPGAAGVVTDERGYVRVDDRLRTNVPGIYAIGDVTGGPAFTHISYDDYRVLRAELLGGPGPVRPLEGADGPHAVVDPDAPVGTHGRLVPYTVFTDPQLGRAGLTEREAREAGYDVKVARMSMDQVARALETDEPRGLVKAVVDRTTDRILGCAVIAVDGGELMAMLEIAMIGGVTASTLRETVFAHPTLAESLNNLFGSFED